MKQIVISRHFSNENKTLSKCIIHDVNYKELARFVAIELPDRGNQRQISCIPSGKYKGLAITRPNGKYAIILQEVPNRTAILIHSANYVRQLQGCIAPGSDFQDIDKDGIIDVINSNKTMELIERHIRLGEDCLINIIDAYKMIGNLDPKTEPKV
jgi:hypothetical protein